MAYNKKYADWKRKIWFKIVAPPEFNEVELGETPAYKPEQVPGRRVEINLALILGDYKMQNYKAKFRIERVEGTTAKTKLESVEMYEPIIQRWVEPGRDKIFDSFVVKDKDGNLVRFKLVMITRRKLHHRQTTAIRKIWREIIANYAQKLTFTDLVKKILNEELQNTIKTQVKKIYPPLFLAIKYAGLEKREKGILLVEPTEVAKEEKAEA